MKPDITTRPIALVGLMGVGKTTVGRRLAKKLGREFYDSDDEIEAASGRTVAGYFRDHGEAEFRNGERRVIERLLDGKPIILATGGGAFIPGPTRDILNRNALTIWLKGDFKTIMERVSRNREKRPLLNVEDPQAKMRELMNIRHPIYAKAHITVPIARGPHIRTVNKVIRAIKQHESENA
jgi:shikimate kinase